REALLRALAALRVELPSELDAAREILQHRDEVIAAGQQEADQVISDAELDRTRLTSTHEVTLGAEREASRLVSEAESVSVRLREETNELCETSLANVEQVLRRTLSSVGLGHERMRAVADLPAPGLRNRPDTDADEPFLSS
ncbi:MAG: hypothetical protein ACRDPW_07625, partial [Mycobacteriales bacterium]